MKWYRSRRMLNVTLEEHNKRIEKTTSNKTKYLLTDYNNLIKDHLVLLDENEQLKKAIEDEIELLVERRFSAYACDDYKTHSVLNTIIEELREVLGDD